MDVLELPEEEEKGKRKKEGCRADGWMERRRVRWGRWENRQVG
jgi:hypothetical protein